MGWIDTHHTLVIQGRGDMWTTVYLGEMIYIFRKGIELRIRQIWHATILLSQVLLRLVLMMTQQNQFLDLFCHLQRHQVKRGKKWQLARL